MLFLYTTLLLRLLLLLLLRVTFVDKNNVTFHRTAELMCAELTPPLSVSCYYR